MDATKLIPRVNAPYAFHRLTDENIYKVDIEDANGIEAIGTHNLITIPEGKAFVGAKIIMLDDAASAGSATVQFKAGGVGLNTAIAYADLTKGQVIKLSAGDDGSCAGYAASADGSFDMVIGAASLTAFSCLVVLETIDVNAIITNG